MMLHAAMIALALRACRQTVRGFSVLMQAIAQETLSRRDRRLLAAMDDQGLCDIGLCRGQVHDAFLSRRSALWSR